MVNKPFFSIIVPTYNRASNLQFAIYCLLRQNFSNFEVIISDNCSTDNTKEIVDKFEDKRIHYFKNKKNIGVTLNYKKALQYAKGEYIFLYSDDDFILYKNSLERIYAKIKKYHPGYIRVNYICQSPDKRRIFDFKVNKSFTKDQYLLPFSEKKKVVQFIIDSDAAFVTGIIFKNNFPHNIKIIDAQPTSWIEIACYVAKKYGAYFINKPHVIASWSKLQIKKNSYNILYSLTDGMLASENYLNVIRRKLDAKTYGKFLHNQLMGIYVRRFPLVKLFVGNKNLLKLSARIRFLDTKMTKSITYWTYLLLAIIIPNFILKITKNIYLYAYMRFSGAENNKQIIASLKKLEQEYIHFLGDLRPIINS